MQMSPRPLVVVLGCSLALAPAACSTLSGGGSSTNQNPSDSTVFRTITVELETSSTTLPDVTLGQTGSTLDPNIYEVKKGDSWSKIAATLKVDMGALLAVNNATTRTVLLPGQRLAIPRPGDSAANGIAPPAPGNAPAAGGSSTAPAQPVPTLAPGSAAGSYQIQPGDSWSKIASKLNVPMAALLAANNATTKTVLLAGKYLKVPQA
jgi:LysM repeat protein